MLRGALTLLMRSVRADAQQRRAHAIRIGAVLFILALLIVASLQPDKGGAPGLRFFISLSYLGIALITLAAIGHFSTAVVEEREEGTLNLLLLADISPVSILLGKSTNRVLSVWLLFVAQFPFALLSLTLGGLTLAQIAAAYFSLAAYLFLMANLALLVSVLVRRTSEAMGLMTVLALMLHGFPPWLNRTASQLVAGGRIPAGGAFENVASSLYDLYARTSVVLEIDRIFEVNRPVQFLNWQVVGSLWFGCLFFALAWVRFRKVVWVVDDSATTRRRTPVRGGRWFSLVRRPWGWALVWKDFHFLAGGPRLMLVKLILIPACVGLCLAFRHWIEVATGLPVWTFIGQSLIVALVVELLLYSSWLFHVERKWGTFPALMLLPQSAARIGYGKFGGCLLGSLPTAVAALLVCGLRGPEPATGDGLEFLGVACAVLVLCQLTILCSLLVNWGALPLAVGILLVISAVVMPLVSGTMTLIEINYHEQYAQFGPMIYATAIISLGLQFEIGRQMRNAAGR